MEHWPRMLLLVATPAAIAAGCHSIFGIDEYDVAPSGTAGTTASGGSGAQPAGGGGSTATGGATPSGGSGGGVACETPDDCPGTDTACHTRSCDDQTCGAINATAGTACAFDGGRVCDGSGACVECNDQDDCTTGGDLCVDHQCVPAQCTDQTQNGEETDIDCGGPDCSPCDNGEGCRVYSDCESRYCAATEVCAACSEDVQCAPAPSTYCDPGAGGRCVAKLGPGESCTRAGVCLSGFCPADDDVCCDEACDGTCVACLASKTGGANGACGAVTANTDPEDECMTGSGPCTPAGTGCNGDDLSPGCNIQSCSCGDIFSVGGAILQVCGPTAEGCDVRVNTQTLPCSTVCQSHGTDCLTVFNDIPSGTCNRDLADELPCTLQQYQSVLCVCALGCGSGPPCPTPQSCTNGTCG